MGRGGGRFTGVADAEEAFASYFGFARWSAPHFGQIGSGFFRS